MVYYSQVSGVKTRALTTLEMALSLKSADEPASTSSQGLIRRSLFRSGEPGISYDPPCYSRWYSRGVVVPMRWPKVAPEWIPYR